MFRCSQRTGRSRPMPARRRPRIRKRPDARWHGPPISRSGGIWCWMERDAWHLRDGMKGEGSQAVMLAADASDPYVRAAPRRLKAPSDVGLQAFAPHTPGLKAFRHHARHTFAIAPALIGPAEVDGETEILFREVTVQDRVHARHEAVAALQVFRVHVGDQGTGFLRQGIRQPRVVEADDLHPGLHLLPHQAVNPLVEFHHVHGPLDEVELGRGNVLGRNRDHGDSDGQQAGRREGPGPHDRTLASRIRASQRSSSNTTKVRTVATTTSSHRPAPAARPSMAAIHTIAAVVNPVTLPDDFCRITPAPRNPMPVTTPWITRLSASPASTSGMFRVVTAIRAEPSETKIGRAHV